MPQTISKVAFQSHLDLENIQVGLKRHLQMKFVTHSKCANITLFIDSISPQSNVDITVTPK